LRLGRVAKRLNLGLKAPKAQSHFTLRSALLPKENESAQMYVCYIDESGTPDIPGNTSHFVLAGLCIPISDWKSIDISISALLKKYGLDGAEFHTAWILRKYLEQSKIPNFDKMDRSARRSAVQQARNKELLRLQKHSSPSYKQVKKTFAQTAEYIHLTLAERRALVSELGDLVASWSNARLFAECIDKTHFDPTITNRSVGEQAFEQLVSRFEQFLVSQGRLGSASYGLLVHDNNETVAKKHTDLMRQFHLNGTLWTKIKQIIDTPLFVNSSLTSMVQIADLCAYALRRYFENGETDLLSKVLVRADRIKKTLVGVRHFAGPKCPCLVCQAHKAPVPRPPKSVPPSPTPASGI
jgi:hypothetical protein